VRDRRELPAIAVETLSAEAREALQPSSRNLQVHGTQLTACREASSVCSGLGNTPRDKHCRNLLQSLLPDGFKGTKPAELRETFNTLWAKFHLPC
jgi:hypothetical protein